MKTPKPRQKTPTVEDPASILKSMTSIIREFPEIYMPLIGVVEAAEHPDARDSEGMASVAALELLCLGAGIPIDKNFDITADELEKIYFGFCPDSDEG